MLRHKKVFEFARNSKHTHKMKRNIGRREPSRQAPRGGLGLLGPFAGALRPPHPTDKTYGDARCSRIVYLHSILISEPEHSEPAFFYHMEGNIPRG